MQGVRSLVDFALSSKLSSPPRVVFASSIAVVTGMNCFPLLAAFCADSSVDVKAHGPVAELPIDAAVDVVNSNGYGHSKWIGEGILEAAHAITGLQTTSVRVGQCSGGINGAWNRDDWVPNIVRSAKALGCLPDNPAVRVLFHDLI